MQHQRGCSALSTNLSIQLPCPAQDKLLHRALFFLTAICCSLAELNILQNIHYNYRIIQVGKDLQNHEGLPHTSSTESHHLITFLITLTSLHAGFKLKSQAEDPYSNPVRTYYTLQREKTEEDYRVYTENFSICSENESKRKSNCCAICHLVLLGCFSVVLKTTIIFDYTDIINLCYV